MDFQQLQRKIENSIPHFPEGIYYDKKNDQPRTPKINSLFLLSAELAGVIAKEEARPSELIFKKSGLVSPRVGNSNYVMKDFMELIEIQ